MKKLISFITGIIISVSLFSQVPEMFNYQAVARNDQGHLIKNQLVVHIPVKTDTHSG